STTNRIFELASRPISRPVQRTFAVLHMACSRQMPRQILREFPDWRFEMAQPTAPRKRAHDAALHALAYRAILRVDEFVDRLCLRTYFLHFRRSVRRSLAACVSRRHAALVDALGNRRQPGEARVDERANIQDQGGIDC